MPERQRVPAHRTSDVDGILSRQDSVTTRPSTETSRVPDTSAAHTTSRHDSEAYTARAAHIASAHDVGVHSIPAPSSLPRAVRIGTTPAFSVGSSSPGAATWTSVQPRTWTRSSSFRATKASRHERTSDDTRPASRPRTYGRTWDTYADAAATPRTHI
ncbi:hypothetical protein B0H19DRAFT_1260239 [Mycena capillaripes]|nr:hypothetical protein B0H19DRAFT_1260239 [Mycena capillaripes]